MHQGVLSTQEQPYQLQHQKFKYHMFSIYHPLKVTKGKSWTYMFLTTIRFSKLIKIAPSLPYKGIRPQFPSHTLQATSKHKMINTSSSLLQRYSCHSHFRVRPSLKPHQQTFLSTSHSRKETCINHKKNLENSNTTCMKFILIRKCKFLCFFNKTL